MGKEGSQEDRRSFVRKHKITTGILLAGAWRAARWWKNELKKLPYQGPDNRTYNSSSDNPEKFEHERARPRSVSDGAPSHEEIAEERVTIPDDDLSGLSDSASLFGPDGLKGIMKDHPKSSG